MDLIDFGLNLSLIGIQYGNYLVKYFNENNLIYHIKNMRPSKVEFVDNGNLPQYVFHEMSEEDANSIINMIKQNPVFKSYDKSYVVRALYESNTLKITLSDLAKI